MILRDNIKYCFTIKLNYKKTYCCCFVLEMPKKDSCNFTKSCHNFKEQLNIDTETSSLS